MNYQKLTLLLCIACIVTLILMVIVLILWLVRNHQKYHYYTDIGANTDPRCKQNRDKVCRGIFIRSIVATVVTVALCVLLIVYFLYFSSTRYTSSHSQAETRTGYHELEEIFTTIETTNQQMQHGCDSWNVILAAQLNIDEALAFTAETDFTTLRHEFYADAWDLITKQPSALSDILDFAYDYGIYYGIEEINCDSFSELEKQRLSVESQIKQSNCLSPVNAPLYKQETSIRLRGMKIDGCNNEEVYYAACAAYNVYLTGHGDMSFAEASFYLTLAYRLYLLSLQMSDVKDSCVLYCAEEVLYAITRLDEELSYDTELASAFLDDYELPLLLYAEAYGQLSVDPFCTTSLQRAKSYLLRYGGEICYILGVKYGMTDALDVCISYYEQYLNTLAADSAEYNQIYAEYLKALNRKGNE